MELCDPLCWYTPPKFNRSPLKNHGWKMNFLSFWVLAYYFQGRAVKLPGIFCVFFSIFVEARIFWLDSPHKNIRPLGCYYFQFQAKFKKKLNTVLLATKLMMTCLKTPFLQGKHPLWSSTFQQNQEMDKKNT